ncbi:hypothetical protein [Butyrivibrio sp. AE2032]|jgi:hypothetical protein|uniref:hypothetical protein n=1 Tax=Butyrivibrio sp. AE2032 TaxID=1458463 RepID=UPI00054E222A|nr:hypothetical protein [Butyrivibrio sp. AE2032]
MNVRRIFLILACLCSAAAVFIPCYVIQLNYETVEGGNISLFSAYPIYGIAILVLDLFVIGATIVGLKKGYVIASLINIGVTISTVVNIAINRESAAAVLRITGSFLNALGSKSTMEYKVEDGAGFFMLIFAAVVILVTMIWNALGNDD